MEISRHWRLKDQRYRLVGSACPICGEVMFPPRLVGPRCISQQVQFVSSGFPRLPALTCNLNKDILKER